MKLHEEKSYRVSNPCRIQLVEPISHTTCQIQLVGLCVTGIIPSFSDFSRSPFSCSVLFSSDTTSLLLLSVVAMVSSASWSWSSGSSRGSRMCVVNTWLSLRMQHFTLVVPTLKDSDTIYLIQKIQYVQNDIKINQISIWSGDPH